MDNKKPNWLLNSRAYEKARSLVNDLLGSPDRLSKMLNQAQTKLVKHKGGRIGELMDLILACFRLLKCYVTGEYRDISFESLALILASIVYFVMPLDVLPDFIFGMGFFDDAVLLGWMLRAVADDIKRFIEWEEKGKPVVIDAEAIDAEPHDAEDN